ncbi:MULTISPECIES: hypothetical protein [unclassified Duganella]|nr:MULTISPECIES: hypothetical protein [unclassified Duganella]
MKKQLIIVAGLAVAAMSPSYAQTLNKGDQHKIALQKARKHATTKQ